MPKLYYLILMKVQHSFTMLNNVKVFLTDFLRILLAKYLLIMKNILITGISKGLGLEIVKILLEEGYYIFGINRSISDNLDHLMQKYEKQIKVFKYDLQDSESIKSLLLGDFIDLNTPISGFINNAAIAYDDLVTNINHQSLQKMYSINVFSPFILTKYVIRNMLLHKTKGSIVHISSISVHTGYKGLSMYASTKGAIESFSKNTAREWGERKIRSNCVVAGFMETKMSAKLSLSQKERIYNRTALKTSTNIQSVANTVSYLLSEKSKSITGQNIFVDSGTI